MLQLMSLAKGYGANCHAVLPGKKAEVIAAHHFRIQDLDVLYEYYRLRVPGPEGGQPLELANLLHPECIQTSLGVQLHHLGESVFRYHLPHNRFEPLNELLQVLGHDPDPGGVLVTAELQEEITAPGQALVQVKIGNTSGRPFVHSAIKTEKDGGTVVPFHEPGCHYPYYSGMPVGRA